VIAENVAAAPARRPLDRRDKILLLTLGAIGAAVWLWFALNTRIALEDAYITFRYARNIAQGHGFVYNVGERVLGTTTPLQTLLLAALGLVFGSAHIPTVAAIVMPMFGLAGGLLAYLALVRLGLPRTGAAAGGLLFYLHPLVIRTSLGGMETPLVLFLMALSLYFVAAKRSVPATAAVALLVLCRVDGLVWGAGIVGLTLLSDYRRPRRQAAVFAAIVLPWLLFSLFYFGSLLPNTVLAKGVVRPGRETLLFQPAYFDLLSRWYISGMGLRTDHPMFRVWVLLLGLGVYAVVRARKRELLALLVFPPVYAALMYFGRAPTFEWYLLPMLFCGVLLGGLGIGQTLSWVAGGRIHWTVRAAVAAGLATAVIFLGLNLARDLPRQVRWERLSEENEFGLRREVGLWLRDCTPRNARVAMEAIGYQGYFSERRIIDMAGLVSPRVVDFRASTGSNGIVFRRILTELKPDYLVLRSFEVDKNRHFHGGRLFVTAGDRDRFFRNYREIARFVAPHPKLWQLVARLTVYERVPPSGPAATSPQP
jgi:hypothetical protein